MEKKIKYVCTQCGSDNVLFDAWAAWNEEKQEMELVTTFDDTYCEQCGGECKVKEIEMEE
jgi:DNA-directed RNA polymerase subunit RPC12/RpoP